MIARIWTTDIELSRAADYASFVESESIPMFSRQEGFRGALFLGSGRRRAVVTFWRDESAAGQLETSPSYLACVQRIVDAGFLAGEQRVDVHEVTRSVFPPAFEGF